MKFGPEEYWITNSISILAMVCIWILIRFGALLLNRIYIQIEVWTDLYHIYDPMVKYPHFVSITFEKNSLAVKTVTKYYYV